MESCEKTNCTVCGKEMDKYSLRYSHSNKKYYRNKKEKSFCSSLCVAQFNKVEVSGHCLVCNEAYKIKVNKPFAHKVKYCSKQCHREFVRKNKEANKYVKNCKLCNKEFRGIASAVFCTDRCSKINKNNERKSILENFKRKLIDQKGGKCCECSKLYDMAAMVFHHNTGVKNFHLNRECLYKRTKEEIDKELELVVLMCQNCHAIKHEQENITNQKEIKHNSIKYKEKGKARKRKLIELKGGRCQKCGFKSNALGAMTFDHIGEKTFHLSACRLMVPWDRILKELDNCELLCLNCHMTKNNLANNKRKIPINLL